MASAGSPPKQKPKVLGLADGLASTQFYPWLDIILLKELYVLELDPHCAKNQEWDVIHENVLDKLRPKKQHVTLRQVKDRAKYLIKKFRADELTSLKSSGTDEEYGERKQLLTELLNLLDENKLVKEDEETDATTSADIGKKVKPKKAGDDLKRETDMKREAEGKIVREKSMESLKRKKVDDENDFVSKSKSSKDVLTYLREKNSAEVELRKEELALQRQALQQQGQILQLLAESLIARK